MVKKGHTKREWQIEQLSWPDPISRTMLGNLNNLCLTDDIDQMGNWVTAVTSAHGQASWFDDRQLSCFLSVATTRKVKRGVAVPPGSCSSLSSLSLPLGSTLAFISLAALFPDHDSWTINFRYAVKEERSHTGPPLQL